MSKANPNTINKSLPARFIGRARFIWIAALSIWLTSVGISALHAQEHAFLDDYKCQLCITSFKHTPVLTSDEIPFLSHDVHSFTIKHEVCFQLSRQPLTISSRDPPIIHS